MHGLFHKKITMVKLQQKHFIKFRRSQIIFCISNRVSTNNIMIYWNIKKGTYKYMTSISQTVYINKLA